MRDIIHKVENHPRYSRFYSWGKLLTITGSAQIIVQVAGLLAGILIIRLIPTKEYAFYTIANTMLGMMTVLADSGISTGVMSQGSKVWSDKEALGRVLTTGLSLRRKFAIGSLLIAIPFLAYLLLHNGASVVTTILIAAALIPSFFAALSDSLLEIIPKLHQNIKPLQINQVGVSVCRLFLSGIVLFIFPWAYLAILISGITRMYGNSKLSKIADEHIIRSRETDKESEKLILKIVGRRLPESIYYCLSSQINIWLISIFGSTASIASLGALTRIGMALSLLTVMFNTLITPRFAKLHHNRAATKKYFFNTLLLSVALLAVVCLITWLFSSTILLLLGGRYTHLNYELVLSVISASCVILLGFIFSLSVSRGWVINPAVYILGSLAGTIAAFLIFDVSTLAGVLYFNILTSSSQGLMLLIYSLMQIKKIES